MLYPFHIHQKSSLLYIPVSRWRALIMQLKVLPSRPANWVRRVWPGMPSIFLTTATADHIFKIRAPQGKTCGAWADLGMIQFGLLEQRRSFLRLYSLPTFRSPATLYFLQNREIAKSRIFWFFLDVTWQRRSQGTWLTPSMHCLTQD